MKKLHPYFISFLVMFFVVIMISDATAVTITIDDDTKGADYNSIQDAVENATDGDTILVFPGNYIENVYVNKELIISSLSGNQVDTIVKAANSEDDVFKVVSDNVTISGFSITGAGIDQYGDDRAGIYFESVNNSIIRENNVYSNGYGILLLDSYNNTLADNSAYMSCIGGIFLWNSSYNRLHNNLINTSNHEGIHLYESSNNNELNNNTVNYTYVGFGIDLTLCDNNTLTSNIVSNNELGFLLTGSNNNSFINNIANSNKWNGVDLQGSNSNNILYNNTANFNSHNGIFLINSNSNRLNFNNASNNAEYGINLNNSSTNNILIGNIADSNGIKNIHVADPVNNTVNTGLPQENDSAQKLLFKSFILAVITIITAALITGRRVREY
ncbi:MAG TPA: NosD domain-containing protein [Methanosarcina sp.]|nr:NosD domain-containing protein [Methanosarcina sp.]